MKAERMTVGRTAIGRTVVLLGAAAAVAFVAGRYTAPEASTTQAQVERERLAAPPSALRQLAQVSRQLGSPRTDPFDALLDAQARAHGPERGRLLTLLGRTGRQEALPVLLEAAASPSPAIRDGAIAGLGEHGDLEAVAMLIALCEHPSAWVRDAAVKGLKAAGNDDARDHLEQLVFGHDEPLGRAAVEAMASWNDARAIDLLTRVARGYDRQLASYAIGTLAKLQGEAALGALLALAEDPALTRLLRAEATAAAGARGPDATTRLTELALTADAQTADAALTALIQVGGDEAVDALLTLAEHRRSMAYSAVSGLSRIGTPAATDALIQLVSSSSPQTAQSAAAELVDIRGEAVDEVLLSVLRGGGHPAERLVGRLAYVRRGPAFAEELLGLVDEGDPMIARGALHALTKQDPKAAVGALSRVARRPGVKHLRLTAVDALASTPAPEALEALLALSRSSSLPREARVRAQRALLDSPHRERAVAGLMENARAARDPQSRMQAVSALAEIADGEMAEELASIMEGLPQRERYSITSAMAQTDGASRKAVTEAVLALDDDKERLELLSNLVHFGDPEAVGALDELAATAGGEQARRALGSLAYADPEAAEAHAEALIDADDPQDRQAALRTFLATASPERVRVASRALDDEDRNVRGEAVRQLVNDARPEALTAVVRAGREHPAEVAPQAGALLATGDPDARRLVRELVLSGGREGGDQALSSLLYHHEPAARELLEDLAAYDTPRGAEIRRRLQQQTRGRISLH